MAQGVSLLEPIVARITEGILNGQYAVGERLPSEAQLQEEWGVSRSVVREAMKVLSSRGLVRIEQGRGTFVCAADAALMQEHLSMALRNTSMSKTGGSGKDDYDHLLDVRRVMEVAVAERAAQFASKDDLRDMEAAIAAMRERPDDTISCANADLLFHSILARSAANPLWPAILGSLNDLLRRLLQIAYHGRENALSTASEHQAILEAVRARDAEAASKAMRAHLETSGKDLLTARRKRRT
jgi:GntR family transcriptional repressor for pyruvate dehydrogenase complex